MVVDDDPEILYATVRLLRQQGYEVIEAQTGHEAIKSTEKYTPDLILLDNMLPDIDGLEVCRRLKIEKETCDIFICIMSGLKISSQDQAEGLETGADDYIARPNENRELLARVRSMVRLINSEYKLKKHQNQLEELVQQRSIDLQNEIDKHKRTELILKESEQKYRNLVEKIDDIIWSTDMDLRTTYVSPSIEKQLGYTQEERKHQKVEETMPPDSLNRATETFIRELKKEHTGGMDPDRPFRIEWEYFHNDGTPVWFENEV